MSLEQVAQILTQAIVSQEFRDLLFSDPDRAFEGYSLTDDETSKLRALTPEHLHRMVGEILAHRLIPIRASRRFVVVSPGSSAPSEPGTQPIVLGPQLAFGNGFHETTQLCLAALEEVVQPGATVIDLGTGTGILAIAAAKLGAGSVLAVDTSAEAVAAAQSNVNENSVKSVVRVKEGSLGLVLQPPDGTSPRQVDVIVANILAPVIIEMIEEGMARALKPDGMLILSGVRGEQQVEVDRALKRAGMVVVETKRSEAWVSLMARHKTL